MMLLAALSFFMCSCGGGGKDAPLEEGALLHVRFQTDWYPQGEHGGFYYALAMGYYAEEGLDVDILPGGITYMGALRVTEGQADFAMNKAEAIIRHTDRGMPLRIVMNTLQHDPQGIMLHDESPVHDFADLDQRPIIAMPGGTWLSFLERKYGISLHVIPSDKGMERFLSDAGMGQQCMVTSEPFYAAKQGVKTRVLLLKDSGFDPSHVVYTSEGFAAEHPEAVQAFVRASIRGWVDYLTKDPSPAFGLIKARNPRQSDEQLEYSRRALIDGGYAFGESGPEGCGKVSAAAMRELGAQLLELGIIKTLPDERLWSLAPAAE
ncbi:MAG: ABC transporter substrate-binding protein [Opitutales bacterium]|nr:ABC transporter substrate-binding protein [Opitutales bacterium]